MSLFHRAKRVLSEAAERVKRDVLAGGAGPPVLEFYGMGHFDTDVAFVKVRDGPAKEKLLQIVGMILSAIEILNALLSRICL